jgi:hypothetical protein
VVVAIVVLAIVFVEKNFIIMCRNWYVMSYGTEGMTSVLVPKFLCRYGYSTMHLINAATLILRSPEFPYSMI